MLMLSAYLRLMAYCEEHKASDILVTGITDSHNPFQEKKSCTVL